MAFKVPSGRTFGPKDINLMRDFDAMRLITWSEEAKILNSGIPSQLYIRGRSDLTDNPRVMNRVGARLMDALRFPPQGMDHSTFCLIGVPVAGNILTAAAFSSDSMLRREGWRSPEYSTSVRYMRENKKAHGDENDRGWVIGKPNYAMHRYVLVENTITSGKGVGIAAARMIEDGYDLSKVDCLIYIDRCQGGLAQIASLGFRRVVVVYYLLDILSAFERLKLWPKELVEKARAEISSHQFS